VNATEELHCKIAGLFYLHAIFVWYTQASKSDVSKCNGWRNLSGWPAVKFMKGHFANGVVRAFAPDVVS